MHLGKGARARGRIRKWCVTIVMAKAIMVIDLDSMYALAHLELRNQDLDATCAGDSATRARIARRPVEDVTRPRQKEEDKKDRDLVKEKGKRNGDRDRQTSVVEKGGREFRHSNNGLDKIKTKMHISFREVRSTNGRQQATPIRDRGHNHCSQIPHHGLGNRDNRKAWVYIVSTTAMASNGEVNREVSRIGKYRIKEVQLGR